MKELSTEEKARRYDNLLVKLQEAKVDNSVCDERYCCVIDDIVPELKESEDEKIREELLSFCQDRKAKYFNDPKYINIDKWIAWLEKQGEQKHSWSEEQIKVCQEVYADILSAKGFDLATINSELKRLKEQFQSAIALLKKQGNNADKVKQQQAIEIPFGAKDSELQEATYHIPEGYHAEVNGNEVIIKKGEQKTTWKPTEEQINAIRLARNCFMINYSSGDSTLSETLLELEEQLKTL